MQAVVGRLGSLVRFGQQLGPYLMLEILMPGGTLLALLVFVYRHRAASIEILASRAPAFVKPLIETFSGLRSIGPVSLRSATLRSEP